MLITMLLAPVAVAAVETALHLHSIELTTEDNAAEAAVVSLTLAYDPAGTFNCVRSVQLCSLHATHGP